MNKRIFAVITLTFLSIVPIIANCQNNPDDFTWSVTTRECKPWTYSWWLGSAVDEANLSRELTRYQDADMGGVNINYKPFDASNWPLYDSGLLGPVTLTPVLTVRPE